MQSELGLSNTETGGIATANLIGYLILSVSGGALAARYGPRIVISTGLAIAGISMIMTGFSNNFVTVSFWRAITGIGSGASNVPAIGLLAAWFAQHRRGLASGIGVTGSSLALIVLGISVPYILKITGNEGWRICWFIFGGFTILLSALSITVLRNNPAEMGILPVGVTEKTITEITGRDKLKWSKVYQSGKVWHLGIIYIAFGFSYIIYITFFSKYLISEINFTQEAAGRLFMLMGWFSLFCGLIWGAFSDKFGRKTALIIVYLIQSASFLIFALFQTCTGAIISAFLFGISAWSIPAIMAATCGDILGPKLAPAGLGFVTLFFGIGQATGPGIAGMLADTFHSFSPALLLASLVAITGAIGSAMLRKT